MTSCLILDLRGKSHALLMVRIKTVKTLKIGPEKTIPCLGLSEWRNHDSDSQKLGFPL